ncbi:MAG: signal peptide peptidase SppA, partial [Sphingobium sp.]
MAFVRSAWRILVGIKDALVLLFLLLFFGLLYTALSYSPAPVASVSSGALVLDLEGVVVEQPQDINPLASLPGRAPQMKEYRLRDVVTALDAAKTDGNVKA